MRLSLSLPPSQPRWSFLPDDSPLCLAATGTDDLINFNSSHLYTLPSYSMQSMFSQALGDYVVTSSLTDAGARAAGSRKAVASVKGGTLIWKATNYVGLSAAHIVESVWLLCCGGILLLTTRGRQGDAAVEVVLEKAGRRLQGAASVLTLTSADGKDAENSIDAPEHVVPVASSASVGKDGLLRVEMPAWSVMVVRVPLAAEPQR